MNGVFALLEHPAKPSKPSPSIWKLPILQLLIGHPDVRLITVRQGLFGAKSSKPTDLLLVRPPRDFEAIFRLHQTRLRVPTCHSIGLQADGGFQTTELKAYPPALCAAIAELWGRSIFERNRLPDARDGAVPDDFARIVQALFSLIGTSSPGPDYCQHGQYAAVWAELYHRFGNWWIHMLAGFGLTLARKCQMSKKWHTYVYYIYTHMN